MIVKIKNLFKLFEKNVYEKAKSMDEFSGTSLETKMKQAREKFKHRTQILLDILFLCYESNLWRGGNIAFLTARFFLFLHQNIF